MMGESLPSASSQASEVSEAASACFRPSASTPVECQADHIIKAGHGEDDGTWAEGWRLAIEDLCGFKFARSSIPESAALVGHQGVLESDPTSQSSQSKKPQADGG